MNPFDDARLAKHYEAWYAGDGRRGDILEKRLLAKRAIFRLLAAGTASDLVPISFP